MIDTAKFKTVLENSKQEITDWNKYSKSSTRPVSLDESIWRVSRIDAIQNQQMALASERRRVQELQRIEAALKRIESGDYGYCMVCEEEISEKRLELDPTYSICVECASGGSEQPQKQFLKPGQPSARATGLIQAASPPDGDAPNRLPVQEISMSHETRRTFAIISHPDAGKTTLTEKLLLFGGAITTAGQVKARRNGRSARSDWMNIERTGARYIRHHLGHDVRATKTCREKAALDSLHGRETWIKRYMLIDLAIFTGLRVQLR